jgi:hypothetical protein
VKITENWQKLQKFGENCRNLAKIAEIWQKSQKFGESRRKLLSKHQPLQTGSNPTIYEHDDVLCK